MEVIPLVILGILALLLFVCPVCTVKKMWRIVKRT